jgi:molybdenum cofactor cytidylyltransferase
VIGAIVLAAGESKRMGTQKLLLPFGDTTVAGTVVRTAETSRVDRVIVVIGADRDRVRAELERGRSAEPPQTAKLVFAVNEDYLSGMLSSIQTGFKSLPPDAEAAVVMLGDQPFLPAEVVDAVVAAYREGGAGIVIPVFRGRRGHPVLVATKYRDEVLGLDPSDGLRQLMRAHPGDIREVEVDDANILRDLDTPEEYEGIKDGVKPTFYPKTGKR